MTRATVIFNILTILAVLIGPIVALQLQRLQERKRELEQRKLWVFRTIMSNRATILNSNYVQALNLIDIDFAGNNKKDKAVRTAWKILLDHLSPPSGQLRSEAEIIASNERADNLRVSLMRTMAEALHYEFDEVQIKKGIYLPSGHTNIENEQNLLRKRVLEVLNGNRRLPVGVFQDSFPDVNVTPDS